MRWGHVALGIGLGAAYWALRRVTRHRRMGVLHPEATSSAGWHRDAPKPGRERAVLYKACGPGAFVRPNKDDPGNSGYPVMPKCAKDRAAPGGFRCECEVDCRGARAAEQRAENESIARDAARLVRYACKQS